MRIFFGYYVGQRSSLMLHNSCHCVSYTLGNCDFSLSPFQLMITLLKNMMPLESAGKLNSKHQED